MGCCVSTANNKATPKPPLKEQQTYQTAPARPRRRVGKAPVESPKPDPPPVEEESVKEVVLSETPVSKPPPETEKPNNAHVAKKPEPEPEPEPKLEELREVFSEVSLVSESCEVSESFSYSTTTTVTEVKDDDEAVSKRTRREVGVGPTARSALHGSPSPSAARRKRPNSGELASRRGRLRGHSSPANMTQREPGRVRAPGRVWEGEGSARRSRSPATRSAGGVGRGGSKVTGRGGGRSGEGLSREVREGKSKEGSENSQLLGNSESLENPLVALECFIFV